MTTGENTCNLEFIAGGRLSEPNGTFRDNLYMCGLSPSGYVAACDGRECLAVRTQRFTADGYLLTPEYEIRYTCSGVSVQ